YLVHRTWYKKGHPTGWPFLKEEFVAG
ncbi:MAG: hypothetical protein RL407_436, partial [Bacteroidota bacterium]